MPALRHPLPTVALRLVTVITLAGAGLAGASAAAHAAPAPSSGCADVEVMVNRGTTEAAPSGLMSVVAKGITSGTTKTVSTWGNPYPASFDFATSAPQGVTTLINRMTSQAKACPNQQFVLIGYSQGAMVIGDALAGGVWSGSSKVTPAVGAKIAAVVLWGNPGFNSAESFDTGTYVKGVNGSYTRPTGALKTYAARILDYCLKDDGVCQGNGATNINAGHLGYPGNSTVTSASSKFALSKLTGSTTPPVVTPTAGPTGSPTPAPTATTPAPVPTTTSPVPVPTSPWGGGWADFWKRIFPWLP